MDERVEIVGSENYIFIAGHEVRLDEFLQLWAGEECRLSLTKRDVADMRYFTEDPDSLVGQIAIKMHKMFGFLGGEASRRSNVEAGQVFKKFAVQNLIADYKSAGGDSVINMDRVLAHAADGDLKYSSVAAFVAACSGVEPTAEVAGLLRDTADELGVLESEHIFAVELTSLEERLGVTSVAILDALELPAGARKAPLQVLDRALLDEPLRPDELQALTEFANLGSSHIVTAIDFTRHSVLAAGGGLLLYNAWNLVGGGVVDLALLQSSIALLSGGVWAEVVYPAKSRKSVVSRMNSDKKYIQLFEDMQARIKELSGSPHGRVQLALLRACLQENARTNEILAALPGPEELDAFNSYAARFTLDYLNLDGVINVLEGFLAHKGEEASYGDPVVALDEEMCDEALGRAVAAQRAGLADPNM
jgi:hypothetical protein